MQKSKCHPLAQVACTPEIGGRRVSFERKTLWGEIRKCLEAKERHSNAEVSMKIGEFTKTKF